MGISVANHLLNKQILSFLIYDSPFTYSLLKLFTGLAKEAFIAWRLTVTRVIDNAPAPEKIKIQNEIVVR